MREWIHVEDHCIGIGLVIANGKSGEIYNIGSGEEVTNLELALTIASHLNKGKEVIDFVEDRKGHDFRYSLDFRKIKEIGFAPTKNLQNEIPKLVSWYEHSGTQS
jgi:dTDP-glucose 4,6-dehydratase